MAGYKVFLSEDSFFLEGRIILDPSESHHLCRVLRAKLGSSVQVLNGGGEFYQTKLVKATPKAAVLSIVAKESYKRSPLALHLIIGVLKPKAMDQVLKRAVEIGVSRIFPVLTEYASFRLDENQSSMKANKWRTTLIEACKQSGNVFLPELMPPCNLKAFFEDYWANKTENAIGVVASTELENPYLVQALNDLKKGFDAIYCAVGPEGDFSPSEYRRFEESGFLSTRLGRYVLRSETAVCYGLSVLDQHTRLLTDGKTFDD